MTVSEIAFWSAITQVIPVIALALVIEARALPKTWTSSLPRWFNTTEGLIWGGTLLVLAIVEIDSLRRIRLNTPAPAWLLTVTDISIAIALGYVVSTPAWKLLLFPHLDTIATILDLHPFRALQMRRLMHQNRKLSFEQQQFYDRRFAQLDEIQDSVKEMKHMRRRVAAALNAVSNLDDDELTPAISDANQESGLLLQEIEAAISKWETQEAADRAALVLEIREERSHRTAFNEGVARDLELIQEEKQKRRSELANALRASALGESSGKREATQEAIAVTGEAGANAREHWHVSEQGARLRRRPVAGRRRLRQ